MKNELIIARYTGQKKRSAAERLRAILAEFGLLKRWAHASACRRAPERAFSRGVGRKSPEPQGWRGVSTITPDTTPSAHPC